MFPIGPTPWTPVKMDTLTQTLRPSSVDARACRDSVRRLHAREVEVARAVARDAAGSAVGTIVSSSPFAAAPDTDTNTDPDAVAPYTDPLPSLPADVVECIFSWVAKEPTRSEIPGVRLVNKKLAEMVPWLSPRWPVQSSVEVRPSPVDGRGMFSTDRLPANASIGRHTGTLLVVSKRFPSHMVSAPMAFQLKKPVAMNPARDWCMMVSPQTDPPPLIQPPQYVNHACSAHAKCMLMEAKASHSMRPYAVVSERSSRAAV